MRFILASGSPRRKEFMERLCIPYEVITSDVDESTATMGSPYERVKSLAEMKAKAVADRIDEEAVIIAADTIVTYMGLILNKPEDSEDAKRMLKMLSGKLHTVYSGMSLIFKDKNGNCTMETYVDGTEVEFAEMSDNLIEKYVNTNEPLDKAGAYAVQEKGSVFIANVKGNYDNVVGLPVPILYDALKRHGIDIADFW
ncbi:MAG: septum formation inhibitor Maf [Firmicutes bacterium]|nr:septum formation inhibitor Maf [Bacillota bacterium]